MDWLAHREANQLAGNPVDYAAIEIGPGGIDLEITGAAIRAGISAFGFVLERDGEPVPTRVAMTLLPGARLSIRPGPSHVWAYLSVSGGFALAPVMGSLSMHARSGIGPLGGGSLVAAMAIPAHAMGRQIDQPDRVGGGEPGLAGGLIRFVSGPQDDHFTAAAHQAMSAGEYAVSARSDRMGYRLDGPSLQHVKSYDVVSDGIAMGAIQVPGDRQPIVLMADRQPTGGYPKIGTVIRADLPRLAQTRSGQTIRFQRISVDAAVAALRATTCRACR